MLKENEVRSERGIGVKLGDGCAETTVLKVKR